MDRSRFLLRPFHEDNSCGSRPQVSLTAAPWTLVIWHSLIISRLPNQIEMHFLYTFLFSRNVVKCYLRVTQQISRTNTRISLLFRLSLSIGALCRFLTKSQTVNW
jgi:hypothetical protein